VFPRRGRQVDLWARIGLYTSLGFILPASAVAGYILGWYLDGWLRTAPVLAVVMAMLGAAGGFIEVLHLVTRAEKSEGRNNANGRTGPS
jgi:F0F1-type ATP synthase assembly protein I